ncbi:MAG TPA: diaminopimelate decarboxylase [Porphyromonadaceae bacterium]|nr:diaminopimelate decarboxylase [Porphyromonadaceae bacterium]
MEEKQYFVISTKDSIYNFKHKVSSVITQCETPVYCYDLDVLKSTLEVIKKESEKYNFKVHYAIKANANPRILSEIQKYDFGADCVSGGEVELALKTNFNPNKIVFAGVGKSDWEIELALKNDIFCFNVESEEELKVIDEIASSLGKKARISFRINPEVDAHTHKNITTGLQENKFGINLSSLDRVLSVLSSLKNVELIGVHFHIGSQITDMQPFKELSSKAMDIVKHIESKGYSLHTINFGGGLGIDYENPDRNLIPDFASYFKIFNENFALKEGREIHFELGRSVVGECGTLLTKVLYVKEGTTKKFAIVDAGFTDLIRPALYQAYHKIENLSSFEKEEKYDVVGPICESTDCFSQNVLLNKVKRGDVLALRSAGAYGEVMAMQYNCRKLPQSIFIESK